MRSIKVLGTIATALALSSCGGEEAAAIKVDPLDGSKVESQVNGQGDSFLGLARSLHSQNSNDLRDMHDATNGTGLDVQLRGVPFVDGDLAEKYPEGKTANLTILTFAEIKAMGGKIQQGEKGLEITFSSECLEDWGGSGPGQRPLTWNTSTSSGRFSEFTVRAEPVTSQPGNDQLYLLDGNLTTFCNGLQENDNPVIDTSGDVLPSLAISPY